MNNSHSRPEDKPDEERDWDREFEELTRGLDWDDAPDVHPARSTFPDAEHPAEPSPWIDDGTTPAVPGFRDQWRVPDPPISADENRAQDDDKTTGEDIFVPPDPRPIDASDPHTVIMIGALIGGPFWLLYLLFFDRQASDLWWAAACGIFIAGFVMAVARQPKARDEDDPDDGARL